MTTALVQSDGGGVPLNGNCYAAYEGFEKRGAACRFITRDELVTDDLSADTVPCGGIAFFQRAVALLCGFTPAPLDYPESLRPFLRRSVWPTTFGRVRAEAETWPVFIKPKDEGKAFTGYVVRRFGDLIKTNAFGDDYSLWASEPIEGLQSEFRTYILRGEILGVKHYKGDYWRTPHPDAIREMMVAYTDAPASYALDVGMVTGESNPVLIEVNDGYSLGNYGLEPTLYAQMIEARWRELTAGATVSRPSGIL